jgi:hypothetical protein
MSRTTTTNTSTTTTAKVLELKLYSTEDKKSV